MNTCSIRRVVLHGKQSEDSNGNNSVDILIGSDYYWDIVTGEVLKGDGPIVVHSKFGWLLSGQIHFDPNYADKKNADYQEGLEKSHADSAARSCDSYMKDPEKSRAQSLESLHGESRKGSC